MNSPYGYSSGGMPPQGSYNPYAAPQVGGASYQASPGPFAYRAHGGTMKWLYLGSLLGTFLFFILGAAVGDEGGGSWWAWGA